MHQCIAIDSGLIPHVHAMHNSLRYEYAILKSRNTIEFDSEDLYGSGRTSYAEYVSAAAIPLLRKEQKIAVGTPLDV